MHSSWLASVILTFTPWEICLPAKADSLLWPSFVIVTIIIIIIIILYTFRLPGWTCVTPSPMLSTMPPPSWPRMTGKRPSGSQPLNVYASVWHTPEYRTCIHDSIMWVMSYRQRRCQQGGGQRVWPPQKMPPPLGGAVVWVFPNVSLTMCPLKLSLVRLLARLWHQHWLPSHKFIRLFRDTAIEMCFLLNCNVYKTNIHWMFTRNIIYCILWTECDTNYNILFDFLTFIRTSPLLGGATSTVSKVNGFFAAQATAALHVIACKITTKHNC